MYNKYKKIIMYLFFGGCTTLVNIVSYYILAHILNAYVMFSTILSWVLAVLFAYFTNRKWVFESKANKKEDVIREITSFFACRLATGIVDWLIMYIFVERLGFNDIVIKIISNIIVIILNYIASKLIVFNDKKKTIGNKKEIMIYLSFMIVVFIFLLKSPLHIWINSNIDVDSGVFKTIALMMQKGYMPYLDTFDHKGPLIYIYNYLGNIINSYNGIWYIEFISLWVTMCYLFKIARLKCSRLSSYIVTLLSITLLFKYFQGGNFSEEYALPFIAVSIFIFLDYLINKKVDNKRLIICGLSFGAVLLLRPNMIATWVVFCIIILINCLKNKKIDELKRFILYFIIGFVIIIVPIILWLIINGAFKDFWYAYIEFNTFYSSISLNPNTTRLANVWTSFIKFINNNIAILSFVIISLLSRKDKINLYYLIYMIISIIFICISGRTFNHYMIIFIPAIIYPFAILLELLEGSKYDKNGIAKTLVLVYLLANIIIPGWIDLLNTLPSIYTRRNENKISREINDVAEIIKRKTSDDDKISVYGNLGIVYVVSNRMHATRYSFTSPIGNISKEIMNEYFSELKEEMPKIIVISTGKYDSRIEMFINENNYNLIKGDINKSDKELLVYEKGI